jgi:beta-mannosidase
MDFRKDAVALDLSGTWQMAFAEDERERRQDSLAALQSVGLTFYPAKVPGNVELDLHRNGLISDPFFGMNIAELPRGERRRVWYVRSFEAPPLPEGHEAWFRFEGASGHLAIYLNGTGYPGCEQVLTDQWVPKPGKANELVLALTPPEPDWVGPVPLGFAQPNRFESLRVRRAPHEYGWDIMPRAVSNGIWRSVKLLYLPEERIENVYLETLSIGPVARLVLHFDCKLAASCYAESYEVEVSGRCGDSEFTKRERMLYSAGRVNVSVPTPWLWWPKGRGETNLYEVTVRIFKNGAEVDHMHFTHGIRTVELIRTSVTDEQGSGEFLFKINGERMFIHGSNWVPVDAFHSRDRERIPQILEMAADLNCNMLRCWGGNVYEDDLFYDICDREGVLIWQDFAMACAVYPQDSEFQRVLADEVRTVVRRLRQHACIALWAGDNECDQAWSWGGRRMDPNQNVLTRHVIPDVLLEEDSGRPYLPSSPYIDPVAYEKGEKYLPENHLWGPRDYYKSRYYTESLCHFASEIGYHGCPARTSLERFLSPEKLWPYKDNDEWILHSTSPIPGYDLYDYRVELMAKQIRELFGTVPDNLDDFVFASQISQAEAKKFFVELFRTSMWRRTGILWWNLMDGWPQMSDAVVDYYFEKKRAYHYLKTAQQPLLLALREPKDWHQELVACSEFRDEARLTFTVTDAESEEVMLHGEGVARPDSVTVLGRIPYSASWKRMYRIEWNSGQSHYLCGNPPFALETYRRWGQAAGLF